METKSYTLTAGQVLSLPLPDARFFMLLDTVFPVDVELRRTIDGGPELATGVEAGFKRWATESQQGFAYCSITSAQAQTIKIGISRLHQMGYDRNIGTVQVVDGTRAQVLADNAFSCSIMKGAVAGNYSAIQVYNPVGSGVRVWIRSFSVFTGALSEVQIYGSNTPLSIVGGAPTINKRLASAVQSVAQKRFEDFAAVPSGVGLIWRGPVSQNSAVTADFQESVLIEEGWGIVAVGGVQNASIGMSVQFLEERL